MTVMVESIRLYAFAKGIEFGALPLAGGIYDQHPKLVEQWATIMAAESREEAKRRKRQEERQRRQMAQSKRGRR
jgi:hypothetical protein